MIKMALVQDGPTCYQYNLKVTSVLICTGCLSIQGALACGTDAEQVKLAMVDWRKNGEAALKKRLQQAQSEGELPAQIQPADFARYLSSLMAGLSVQAANGATRADLQRVAEIALRCIETGLSGSASS